MMTQLNGLLLIDKPSGISSNRCLQKVRRIAGIKKAGHTGTLDPLATGLLPISCGKATRLAEYLLLDDKSYQGTVRLGTRTTTADSEGDIISQAPVPDFDQSQLDQIAQSLTGETEQIPPIYSAIKVGGKAMYQLARTSAAELPLLKPRPIHIFSLAISKRSNELLDLSVRCSKGTYIRTLAEQIANGLGTEGHLCALRRTSCGSFSVEDAVTLEQLEAEPDLAALILGMEQMVSALPGIALDSEQKQKIAKGIALKLPSDNLRGTIALLFEGRLVALARVDGTNGRIAPVKVFCG